MADIIQGQLNVIHSMRDTKPTAEIRPTQQNEEGNFKNEATEQLHQDDLALKGTRKMMGQTSINRRLANMAISGAERVMNYQFDEAIFRESIFGDKRSMKKIQNQKTNYNIITNNVKGLVGSAITSFALGQPLIFGIQLGQMVGNMGANSITRVQQLRHFEERANLELYQNSKRQGRVIVGTYNRR